MVRPLGAASGDEEVEAEAEAARRFFFTGDGGGRRERGRSGGVKELRDFVFLFFFAGSPRRRPRINRREQKQAETRTRHVETPGSAHDTRQPRIGGPSMNRRQDGCGGADPTRYMKFHILLYIHIPVMNS
jgi:hypothetical protein